MFLKKVLRFVRNVNGGIMSKLWKLLAEKGKIATVIGLLLSLPANGLALWSLFFDKNLSHDQLWQIVIINAIGMVWFILPSKISIKSGKGLEIIIED